MPAEQEQLEQAAEMVDAMLQRHQYALSDFNLDSDRISYHRYVKLEDEGPTTPNIRHYYTAQKGLIPLEPETEFKAVDILTDAGETQLLELERRHAGIRNMLEYEAIYQGSKIVIGGTRQTELDQKEDMGNRFQAVIRVPADETYRRYLHLRGALQQTLASVSGAEGAYTITTPGLLSLHHLRSMLSEDKNDDATFNGQYL